MKPSLPAPAPLLSTISSDELEQFWRAYGRARNPQNLEDLIVAYQALVQKIARQIKNRLPRTVDIDDLIQEGYLGLRRAIERFDRRRNIKFTTFAAWYISGAMLDSLRDASWEPRLVLARARQVANATQNFINIHGRSPSEVELAESMCLTKEKLAAVLKDSRRVTCTSLSAPRFTTDADDSRPQLQPDHKTIDPHMQAQANDLRDLITRGFTRAERLIILLYYYENMTMREIGLALDISESRVSQLHTLIVEQLKARLHAQKQQFE